MDKYMTLLWGSGIVFHRNYQMIKALENVGMIKVIGITSNDNIYESILGYPFIYKKSLVLDDIDKVIIMATGSIYNSIKSEAIRLGIQESNIIPIDVVGLYGFDIKKYEDIKLNPPTIFAPNCWGGIAYHLLGLKFYSPFINMFLEEGDYMKFLNNPKHYIESKLCYYESKYNSDIDLNYPVVMCDDIKLYFNHYSTYEEALESWERRKKRINWNNLLVMNYTSNLDIINSFVRLEYKKKICFANRKYSGSENVLFIKYEDDASFYNIVNRCAKGEIIFGSMFDLMLDGKIDTNTVFLT